MSFPGGRPVFCAHDSTVSGICKVTCGLILPSCIFADRMIREERAAFSDALIVFAEMGADDLRLLHLHTQVLLRKVNGCQDGETGIPLAAAGAADLPDGGEGFRRHLVGQGEGPERTREMIRIQNSWKMEYLELSLCARYEQPHGPLARPYKTEPKHLTRPE